MKIWIYFAMIISFNAYADQIIVIENKNVDNKPMQYAGVLVPGEVVEIDSPAHASIAAKYVSFGDQVKKDDVLFELSSPDLQVRLNEEKMRLFEYQQHLEKLQRWDSSSEVLQAQYSLSRAEDEFEHDKDRFEQSQKLYNAGIVSKEEFAQDERSYKHSLNHYNQSKQNLSDIKKKGGEQYIKLAKLKVSQCEAQIKLLNDKMQALTIRSPLTGIFLPPIRPDATREWANASHRKSYQEDQSLGIVAQNDHIYVQIKVDEYDIINIHKDQEAKVSLLALSGKPFQGKIHEINLLTNKASQSQPSASFDVKIKLEDVDPKLKDKILLGMSAMVHLKTPKLQGIFVPKNAITVKNEDTFVTVLDNNEKSTLQKVEIGPTSNDQVLISKGLKVGDKVVVFS